MEWESDIWINISWRIRNGNLQDYLGFRGGHRVRVCSHWNWFNTRSQLCNGTCVIVVTTDKNSNGTDKKRNRENMKKEQQQKRLGETRNIRNTNLASWHSGNTTLYLGCVAFESSWGLCAIFTDIFRAMAQPCRNIPDCTSIAPHPLQYSYQHWASRHDTSNDNKETRPLRIAIYSHCAMSSIWKGSL
jgi:hypothetical protein